MMICGCMRCKSERHDYMKTALEDIRSLLGPMMNDGFSDSVKESNANLAWQRAYTTLKAMDPTTPQSFGPAPASSVTSTGSGGAA